MSSQSKMSLAAGVSDSLRSDIIAGVFPPGQHLIEDRLSERYGVSRIPVREALRGLEAEGFVTIAPYRGAQVSRLTANDALDLLEVREVLEVVATRRAAANRSWEGIQEMARILAAGNQALTAGRLEELGGLNSQLHMLLVATSGNQNLIVLHEQIQAKARWVYSVGLDDRAVDSWHEHEAIVAAVAAGDSELAGQLASLHINQATHHFREHAAEVELTEDGQGMDTALSPT
jgi:DNA-binding GntR family transcriptional regulator